MSLILDTSISLAWCFEDEQTPQVMLLLDRVTDQGAVVPQLWPLEVLNGLLSAERRGRITADGRNRLADFLHDLPIAVDDETTIRLWTGTVRLAALHRLTAYDASYLELAIRRRLPLATADVALRTAARHEGVELL